MNIHKIFSFAFSTFFILVFTRNIDYFQGFNQTVDSLAAIENVFYHKGQGGFVYVYLPAIFSTLFLIFPGQAAHWFSPRNGDNGYVLKEGFWIVAGYFTALVGWGLLFVFE